MTVYPPDFLRSLPSIPVPASVSAVAGCSCGGLDWHREDCAIWSVAPDEALAAVEDARRRLREFGEDLNRQLHAALAQVDGPPMTNTAVTAVQPNGRWETDHAR